MLRVKLYYVILKRTYIVRYITEFIAYDLILRQMYVKDVLILDTILLLPFVLRFKFLSYWGRG